MSDATSEPHVPSRARQRGVRVQRECHPNEYGYMSHLFDRPAGPFTPCRCGQSYLDDPMFWS